MYFSKTNATIALYIYIFILTNKSILFINSQEQLYFASSSLVACKQVINNLNKPHLYALQGNYFICLL